MNERIRELAETAGWKKTRWGGGEGWTCADSNVSLESFAELVIQDTIKTLSGLMIRGTDKDSAYHNHIISESIKAIMENTK